MEGYENVKLISETQGPTQKQSEGINDFLRYRRYCSDKQMVDKPTINLTSDCITGWHGPSSKTLRDLLQKIVENNLSKEMNRLHKNIYDLYSLKEGQQDFRHTIEDEDYRKNLDSIDCAKSLSKRIQESQGKWGAYIHFINTNNTGRCQARISLNVRLDHIPTVTKYLVRNAAESDHISHIKVAYIVDTVIYSLDNIIIYSRNLDIKKEKKENIENLQYIIMKCSKYI